MLNILLNFSIEGISIYHILSWFFVYSFLGWVWETTFVSIKSRKFVNRGFVLGPCLTIYGSGAVLVYMILMKLEGNYVLLFFLGIIVATVLEYVTAVVMEALFHTSWWDYSNAFCNFQGRICLGSSLFWGVLTVLLFRFLQPFVSWLVNLIPQNIGENILMIVMVLYVVDFTVACIGAANIAAKLEQMNAVLDEFGDYLKSTRIASQAGNLRLRADHFRAAIMSKTARKRVENAHSTILEQIKNHPELQVKLDSLETKFSEFRDKYLRVHSGLNHYERRILRNYPNLGRGTAARRKKHEKADNTQSKN